MDIEAVKGKIETWLDEKFMQQAEYFLVDLKIQGRKISVFIDGDKGVSIDKCAEFSRYLERHLDGEMLIEDNYILEVSSPGIDNPFKVNRQYRNGIGKEVSVIKFDGIRLDGILRDVNDNLLMLETPIKEKGKPVGTKIDKILLTEIKTTKLKINF